MTTDAVSKSEASTSPTFSGREQLNIVVVGHVDHGKSTVIGRLLADTGSLPEGKLEQVKLQCVKNSRPFEYAFLLDALKNEQAQGITIDTARCFFSTEKRDYIIHDAPGHVEFLKNMVTGTARAEAALLIIDAHEGIQENSKRHGYLVSMLGVPQVSIVVNKMDLVDYSQERFNNIRDDFLKFLAHLGVEPVSFIPISAREGQNITTPSSAMDWYTGPSILEQIDGFDRPLSGSDLVFRMPVQDIYKFTNLGDDRRIVVGTIETGRIHVGDAVTFLPSGKTSEIQSIEAFNAPEQTEAQAGQSTSVTLTRQIYIKPGEIMCRTEESTPRIGMRFRVNLFWMSRSPLVKNKQYKLKLATAQVNVSLIKILHVLDASELSTVMTKQQVDRHDVAECELETSHPISFDLYSEVEATGRFVIVDNMEIAGCGVVLEHIEDSDTILHQHVEQRDFRWDKGFVTPTRREAYFKHKGKFIVFTGTAEDKKRELAKTLEEKFFRNRCNTYYLGIGNIFEDLDAGDRVRSVSRDDQIRRLGELAHIMSDAGLLLITTLTDVDDYDLEVLKLLNEPNEMFVVNVGENVLSHFPVSMQIDEDLDFGEIINSVIKELNTQDILSDYNI